MRCCGVFYVISIYSRMPRKSQQKNTDTSKSHQEEMKAGGLFDFFGSTLSVEQAQKAVEQAKAQLKKAQDQLTKAKDAEAAKPPAPAPAPGAPAASTSVFSSFKWPSFGSSNTAPAPAQAPAPAPAPAQGQPPNQLGGKKRSGKKSRRKH